MRGLYRSRLKANLDKESQNFISSLRVDQPLLNYEVDSSLAHLIMLHARKITPQDQAEKLASALLTVRTRRIPSRGFEDIHEYVEAAVTKIVGEDIGGRLHTARSRNDQVASVTRMFCRERILELGEAIFLLAETLLQISEKHGKDASLSYTHLQQAQLETLGFHIQSYLPPFVRSLQRLLECYARTNLSPLGASAGAGSTIKVDRHQTAELLGFDGLVQNCQDAVLSRDYAEEAVFIQTLIMLDLSRIAEDLILWSSTEFRYFELPDSLSSPSSIMPHKKNPDLLELVRAHTATQIANLAQMETILKGLPSGYNRDLQQLKEILLRSFPQTLDSIKIVGRCLSLGRFDIKQMKKRAEDSVAFALPLAEWLVLNRALPMRQAHRVAGRIAAKIWADETSDAITSSRKLQKLMRESDGLKLSFKEIDALLHALAPESILAATQTEGGPSFDEVANTQSNLKRNLNDMSHFFGEARARLQKAHENLEGTTRGLISGPS